MKFDPMMDHDCGPADLPPGNVNKTLKDALGREIDVSNFKRHPQTAEEVFGTAPIKPHRWAEVIKAWADGKTVQFLNDDGTIHNHNCYDPDNGFELNWNAPHGKWRIKPEQKTGWIVLFNTTLGKHEVCAPIFLSELAAKTYAAECPVEWTAIACIQITYTEGEGLE